MTTHDAIILSPVAAMAVLPSDWIESLRQSFIGDETFENVLYAFALFSFICVVLLLSYFCCCFSNRSVISTAHDIARLNNLRHLRQVYPSPVRPQLPAQAGGLESPEQQPFAFTGQPLGGLGAPSIQFKRVSRSPTGAGNMYMVSGGQMMQIPLTGVPTTNNIASAPILARTPGRHPQTVHTLRSSGKTTMSAHGINNSSSKALAENVFRSASELVERSSQPSSQTSALIVIRPPSPTQPVDAKQVARMRLKAFNGTGNQLAYSQSGEMDCQSDFAAISVASGSKTTNAQSGPDVRSRGSLVQRRKSSKLDEDERRNSISQIKSVESRIREVLSKGQDRKQAKSLNKESSDVTAPTGQTAATVVEAPSKTKPTRPGESPTLYKQPSSPSPTTTIDTSAKPSTVQFQGLSAVFSDIAAEGQESSIKDREPTPSTSFPLTPTSSPISPNPPTLVAQDNKKLSSDRMVSVCESNIYKPSEPDKSCLPTSISREIMSTTGLTSKPAAAKELRSPSREVKQETKSIEKLSTGQEKMIKTVLPKSLPTASKKNKTGEEQKAIPPKSAEEQLAVSKVKSKRTETSPKANVKK